MKTRSVHRCSEMKKRSFWFHSVDIVLDWENVHRKFSERISPAITYEKCYTRILKDFVYICEMFLV